MNQILKKREEPSTKIMQKQSNLRKSAASRTGVKIAKFRIPSKTIANFFPFQCSRDSAKMCLPMISTVFMLTQTTTRMHDVHIRSMEAMANFTKAADAFPSEDVSFNLAVDEAKKLLRDLKIGRSNNFCL